MNIPGNALLFANAAHAAIDQRRKYTGLPYIVHPVAVAQLVKQAANYDDAMLCAAYLHDVVEDTGVTLALLREYFDVRVCKLVDELTNKVPMSAGNRKTRFKLETERIATISNDAMTIKLCDLIDNTATIVAHDPDFAKVYMREKQVLLTVLQGGDFGLWQRADKIVRDYWMGKPYV
ncbi:HD domain-containing protein [Phyllobacterium myrsinacearum]|uniref:(P)ppGpp synthase/HD superfamily hydrolase n=1 Tax=Phyllobacterium myrsinacearum TaxID=28101 RepID=A0A839EMA2_9HYPH|nr:HD domain-containing protein [Phyllobacterium myrsinacearum]MBA8881693.1 (p)ppGpp synthase/HD superfamily hydrolase [Phyllobacterium myrsinacearum]